MKVNFFNILLATTMLLILQISHAEVFRWVDEFGKIRIGIKPSDEPSNVEKKQNKSTKTSKALQVTTDPIIPEAVPEPEAIAPEPEPEAVVLESELIVLEPEPVALESEAVVLDPETIEEQTTPAAKIIEIPQTIAPMIKTIPKPAIVVPETIPPTEEEISAGEHSKEMCVVFTGYVNDYEVKVRDCSSSFCDIYKRSLTRYKKKQRSYCK